MDVCQSDCIEMVLYYSESAQKTWTEQKIFTNRLFTIPRRNKEGENKWNMAKCGDDKKDTRFNDEVENYIYYVKVRKVRV